MSTSSLSESTTTAADEQPCHLQRRNRSIAIFRSSAHAFGYYTLTCDGVWLLGATGLAAEFALADESSTEVIPVHAMYARIVSEEIPLRVSWASDGSLAHGLHRSSVANVCDILAQLRPVPYEGLASLLANGVEDLVDPR